jgi:predicted Ser/Thr protein kinase
VPAVPGFEIRSVLGQGGMGVVYLAQDVRLHRPVALKFPRFSGDEAARDRGRFLREARVAATLCHRNICPIYDLGEAAGIPYIVMPLVRGKSLRERLRTGRPSVHEAVELVRKVALAVGEAHRHGIVHRDLKPGNIMIDEQNEPVVMDFGLAHLNEQGARLTRTGDVLGTPAYMPPEQFDAQPGRAGPASDVYSLGVILFELLTGTLPFQGDRLSLACQVATMEPPAPSLRRPGLDLRLDPVCLRALSKEPGDRWPSMQALVDALDIAHSGDSGPCKPQASGASPAPAGPGLTLRVEGTSYAYQPAAGQDIITLGRQRRRLDGVGGDGNDLVLRIRNHDEKSIRISRRHLELRRQDDGYVVIDRSKTGTWRNGTPLPRDVAVPLAHGDRLVLAGLICLEVLLCPPAGTGSLEEVQFPTGDPGGGLAVLQVSQGDLFTVE